MTTLGRRITALKALHSPAPLATPVLRILGDASPADCAAIQQAEAEGRPVVLARCVDASVLEPDTAGAMQ